MKNVIIAVGLAAMLSGCALLSGGKTLTEAECRALDNFLEFEWRGYEDTKNGMGDTFLEKFTWYLDYCEFVQEDIQDGSEDDSGDSDADAEADTDTDTDGDSSGGASSDGGEN